MGNNDYGTDVPARKPTFPKWAVLALFAASASAVWTEVAFTALWRLLSSLPLGDFAKLDSVLWDGSVPFAAYSLVALLGISSLAYAFSSYRKPFSWVSFAVCLSSGVWASAFFSTISLAFSDPDSGKTYYSLSQIRKWECSEDFSECSTSFEARTGSGNETVSVWPVKTTWMSAGDAVRTVSSKRSDAERTTGK